MNATIKKEIRRRKRLYRKAKKSNNASCWAKFKFVRNRVISIIRQSKENYYERLSSMLKSGTLSSRDWWKTLKSMISQHTETCIPPLFDVSSDSLIVDDHEKANLLNVHFANQSCTDDSFSNIPVERFQLEHDTLDTINIIPTEVLDILKTLKTGKASGPDGINNIILIETAHQLAPHLSELFNFLLNISSVPNSWKVSNVCPIFKSGDPSFPSNYRPLSLLNRIEKVLERVIFKHVFNHLKDNNFITSHQSGFMPGDSTVNQVTSIYNNICKVLDDCLEFRVVFFDISKALNKVWHKGLLFKLRRVGIGGKLLNWFSDYLSNRFQRVVLPGGVSSLCHVQAGVSQGSILGPLLFFIYINDIVDDIRANINLFADDTSLSIVVREPASAGTII